MVWRLGWTLAVGLAVAGCGDAVVQPLAVAMDTALVDAAADAVAEPTDATVLGDAAAATATRLDAAGDAPADVYGDAAADARAAAADAAPADVPPRADSAVISDAAVTPSDGGSAADGGGADAAPTDAAAGSDVAKDGSASVQDGSAAADATPPAAKPFHVTGYYAGWMASHLPVSEIDFSALTTVVHFSIFPKADGTFDTTSNGITAAQTQALVQAAHAKQRQVLLGVGGSWTQEGFRTWMKPAKRAEFVQLVVQRIKKGGYDGVDLDMEPIDSSDAKDFVPFVQDLRAAMDAVDPAWLLTAAVGWNEKAYGPVAKLLDRVNIMTYDLSGPWPGWETWHNTPLSNGGKTFASTGAPMPSCQTLYNEAVAAGAPKAKLGIGIVFYAYVWSGADGPNQPIGGVQVKANMPWFEMMDTLYAAKYEKWHKGPQAPYLSIGSGAAGKFVSYDNEASIAAKIAWAKQQGLAGVIIWELGGGWRPSQPKGQRDVLLQAVKQAAWP